MTGPSEAAWETIWLGAEDTAEEDGWLPAQWDVKYNELSVFEGKVTFGAINRDSDDIVSSYVMSDFSGGGQIDLLTGADQSRYRHAIADTQSPGTITLPQYVQETDVPSGATGTTYPAYYIGDVVFGIWGTKVYPWDEDTDTWGSGVTILEPSAKPTMFANKVFIPNGSNGYTILSGSTPTVNQYNGVDVPASESATSDPDAVDFEVWDNRIWALTTSGCLAYSFTGATGSWNWSFGWNNATGQPIKFDDSRPPKKLFTYADNNGDPILHAATTRAVYRHDPVQEAWVPTTIQFAPHPDFGKAVAVWRPGEDLHIGVGLQKITYTAAGVIDPDQGLSRNDGMPYTNLGTISDLEPETSRLYACVSGSEFGFSVFDFISKFGTVGTGDTNFNAPQQVAVDSSGNIYVADFGNDRVKKHDSSGTFVSNIITGVDEIRGLAIDASDNIYISFKNGTNDYRVRKYNSSGTTQWTSAASALEYSQVAVTGARVWVGERNGVRCDQFNAPTGSSLASATGLKQPFGLTVGNFSVYVTNLGDSTVKQYSLTGTFIRSWGSNGNGDGEFLNPTGIAVHPPTGNVFVADSSRNDIQEFTSTGAFIRVHGISGTGDGEYSGPLGLEFDAAGEVLHVADSGNHRIQLIDTEDVVRQVPAVPSIHYWTGLGWHGAWELPDEPDEQLTWGCVAATSHTTDGYSYWFGCTNGKLYRIPLRRTFHNPRAGWQAGYDRFAPTGYVISSRFDALMSGFYKKASRLVVYMDNATPTEKVTVYYKIDNEADAWTGLGEVTSTGRTILTFGDDDDGFSWGERFNWIQFKFELERADDEEQDQYQTPVIAALVLNYTKLPQQARTFSFTIPFPKQEWNERSGTDIENHLSDMLAASGYLKLVHRDRTYRGQLAAVAGITSLGPNYYGGATANFIEIRTSD